MLYGLLLKKKISIFKKIRVLEKVYESQSRKKDSVIANSAKVQDVVLQGSCIFFGKKYINEQDEVFCPQTFLYYEEDILALKCKKNNYITRYIPHLQVLHLEGVSTKEDNIAELDSKIFTFRESIISGKVYRKYLLGCYKKR